MFTKLIDLKPTIRSVLKNVRWAQGVNMASAIVTKSSPLPRINYTESFITCPRSISPPAGEGTEIVVVVALLSPSSSSSCSSFATSLSLICPPPMHCQLALPILAWREIFQHSQLHRPLVWPIEVLWITPASPWRCSDFGECLRGSWWARLSAACTSTICLFAHSQPVHQHITCGEMGRRRAFVLTLWERTFPYWLHWHLSKGEVQSLHLSQWWYIGGGNMHIVKSSYCTCPCNNLKLHWIPQMAWNGQ